MATIQANILISYRNDVEVDKSSEHESISAARAWVEAELPRFASEDPQVLQWADVEIEGIEVLYADLDNHHVKWAHADLR